MRKKIPAVLLAFLIAALPLGAPVASWAQIAKEVPAQSLGSMDVGLGAGVSATVETPLDFQEPSEALLGDGIAGQNLDSEETVAQKIVPAAIAAASLPKLPEAAAVSNSVRAQAPFTPAAAHLTQKQAAREMAAVDLEGMARLSEGGDQSGRTASAASFEDEFDGSKSGDSVGREGDGGVAPERMLHARLEVSKGGKEKPEDPAGKRDSMDEFLSRNGVAEADRPAVKKEIAEIWDVLSAVGAAAGGASGVKFKVGQWWQTDLENGVIYIPLAEIIKHRGNVNALIGGILHEAAHVFYSRFHQVPAYRELVQKARHPAAVHLFFNILDDMYIENVEVQRLPGAQMYLREIQKLYRPDLFGGKLEDQDKKSKPLPHEEYLGALQSFWITRAWPKKFVSPEAAKAVSQTKAAVAEILKMLPKQDFPGENERILLSEKRFNHIAKEILPHYEKLLRLSEEQLDQEEKNSGQSNGQSKGQSNGQSGGQSQSQEQGNQDSQSEENQNGQGGDKRPGSGLSRKSKQKDGQQGSSQGEDQKDEKGSGQASAADKIIEDRAQRGLDRLHPTHKHGEDKQGEGDEHSSGQKDGQQDSESLGPGQAAPSAQEQDRPTERTAPPGATARDNNGELKTPDVVKRMMEDWRSINRAVEPSNTFEDVLADISRFIDPLVGRLENIFQKNCRATWEGSFKSGPRINMKKWMRSEARGWSNEGDFKVFDRRRLPTRRDYSFRLLIDLSGSMSGANMRYALETEVLFMEALERLGIDHSLMGFSDEPYLFKDFASDPAAVRAMSNEEKSALIDQVVTAGGGGTEDTGAVYAAIAGDVKKGISGLKDQMGDQRVLIVITDGEGNGAASNRMDSVLEWAKKNGVIVIGVGVGEGMSYVEKRYPHHVLVQDMARLSDAISDIIEERIEEGFAQRDGSAGAEDPASGSGLIPSP